MFCTGRLHHSVLLKRKSVGQVLEIRVEGTARDVGRQHAEATLFMREQVVAGVERVKALFPLASVADELAEITAALGKHSPDSLEQIAGMAEVFELSRKEMLLSVLQTYFQGRKRVQEVEDVASDHGCSTYAHASTAGTALVKNRDTSPIFLDMQTILHVAEPGLFEWSALSTAGAPGVHSAGMNEHGLGVVDTHVPSAASGPGVPRFSLMMNMLQRCKTVSEALISYQSTPSMGYGNMVLQDADGDIAVIESGYAKSAIRRTNGEFLVATNHFVSEAMQPSCLEPPDSARGADSRERFQTLEAHVGEAGAELLGDPLAPMRHHSHKPSGSICVHGVKSSETISAIVLRPKERGFAVTHGSPCHAELIEYSPWG